MARRIFKMSFTNVALAEVAGTTQRAVFYYETEAAFPPAPAVIDLARALQVSTDELLGVRPPRVERYARACVILLPVEGRFSGCVLSVFGSDQRFSIDGLDCIDSSFKRK
jgi:hypothetical protein